MTCNILRFCTSAILAASLLMLGSCNILQKPTPILADFPSESTEQIGTPNYEVFDLNPEQENLLLVPPALEANKEEGTSLSALSTRDTTTQAPMQQRPTVAAEKETQPKSVEQMIETATPPSVEKKSEVVVQENNQRKKIESVAAKMEAQHPRIRKKADLKLATMKDVAILWQVPSEIVSVYHLEYGYKDDALDKYKALPVKALKKVSHPKHGSLFRYIVKDVPYEAQLYFRLQAENQNGRSRKSNILKAQ